MSGLRNSMDDPNPVVHIVAVMALGTMGVQALETLIDGLNTCENLSVGVSIINALGGIIDDRSMTALKAISEDESKDPYLQESAKSAMSRLEQITQFSKVKSQQQNNE